jgi:tetratricopeptide (TPR) repeat protein
VRDYPDNVDYRRLLLITYGHLGDAYGPAEAAGLGRLPESVNAFQQAADIAEWISQRDPQDRKARFDLVVARMRIAASLLEEPDGARQALDLLTKAQPMIARLVQDDPTNQRFRLYATLLDCHMGKALAALGRDDEAAARLEKGLAEIKDFQGGSNELTTRGWRIVAATRLGQLRAKKGSPQALSLANEMAALISSVPAASLGGPWTQAKCYARVGSLYLQIERSHDATPWLEKSAALWRQMTVPAALEELRKKELAEVQHDLDNR